MAISVSKRTQHCTLCKNHGFNTPKKGHQCFYLDCLCVLCKLTKKAQVAMRHQQRVWRHQKQKLKSQKIDIEDISSTIENKSSKSQACDKCRNHNILTLKRNHQCRYWNCSCEYCSLTFKRREIMKHQQRVRRSKITTQVDSDIGSEQSGGEKANHGDGKEYVYLRNQESQSDLPDKHTEHSKKPEVSDTQTFNQQQITGRAEKEGSIIRMENLSLRPGVIENEKSRLYDQPHPIPFEGISSQLSVNQEPIKDSPGSSNKVLQRQNSSPLHCFPIVKQPVSYSNHFSYQADRKVNHSFAEKYPCAPSQFEPFLEKYVDDSRKVPSAMVIPIDINGSSPINPSITSSFQTLSSPPSPQLSQRLAARNASLPQTASCEKFSSQMDAFPYLNNRGWVSSSFIGPPFENISHSTALILHHQQQQSKQQQKQIMGALHGKQTTYPPPLSMLSGRPATTDSFEPGFWNRILFPFTPINWNLNSKNPIESCLEHYSEINSHSQFPHSEFYHPTS